MRAKNRELTRLGFALGSLLAAYVGIYVVLSAMGQYVPGTWGPSHVKNYMWAPYGFVSDAEGMLWNRTLRNCFFPLWVIDIRAVHTYDRAWYGDYPVNQILNDRLQAAHREYEARQAAAQASASGGADTRSTSP